MNITIFDATLVAALLAATVAQPASGAPAGRRVVTAPSLLKALPPACPATGRRSAAALALRVIVLTSDQRLLCITENAPDNAGSIGFISGAGEHILGIDYRVQDGLLYGLGEAGGIFVLNTDTAVATLVTRVSVNLCCGRAIDFDPAADRLRIISETFENLSQDVNPGGQTVLDAEIQGGRGTGAAYTNNDLSSKTGAMLYQIDGGSVFAQAPAEAGLLSFVGELHPDLEPPFDIRFPINMDIYSTVRNGVAVTNKALAIFAIDDSGPVDLFEVNLATGKSTRRGRVDFNAIDLAIPLNQY